MITIGIGTGVGFGNSGLIQNPMHKAISVASKLNGVLYFIKSNLSNVFQNSDGTGAVTTVGDSIGYIKDMGENDKNAIQSNASYKPKLTQLENGVYGLLFDGTNDFLDTQCSAGGASDFTLTVIAQTSKNNTVAAGCLAAASDTRSYIGRNNTGYIGGGIDGVNFDTLASTTEQFSNFKVVTLQRSGTTGKLWVDGVLQDTETVTETVSSINAYIGALNNNGTASNFLNGAVVGMFGVPLAISDNDRNTIETFFLSLMNPTAWLDGLAADDWFPTLVLDFENNDYSANEQPKNISDILTITRSTTGTYWDANGVMQTADINEPRFDYSTGRRGLLIEGQRTNLLKYTESLLTTSSYWVRGSSCTYTNGQSSPLYGSTCVLIEGLSGTGISGSGTTIYSPANSVTAGTTYTFSVWAKLKTPSLDRIALRLKTNSSSSNTYAYATLSSNEWTRVSVTKTIPSGDVNMDCVIGTETGNLDVYLACAQLEVGAFPSSYIPTTSAAVTRSTDIVSNSSSNTVKFSDWYNQSEGTFYIDFNQDHSPTASQRLLEVYQDANNSIDVVHSSSVAQIIRTYGGSTEFGPTYSDAWSSNFKKQAAALKTDQCASVAEGGTVVTDTSSSIPTGMISISIGSKNDGTIPFFGHICELRYYPKRISDTELQRITSPF